MQAVTILTPLVFWPTVNVSHEGSIVPRYVSCSGEQHIYPPATPGTILLEASPGRHLVKLEGHDAFRFCGPDEFKVLNPE
jgi:hypothetical protein